MDKFCEACTVLLQVIADADPDQFPKHGSAFPPAGKNASDVARHAAGSYSRKRLSGKLSFGKHRLAVSHTGNEQCQCPSDFAFPGCVNYRLRTENQSPRVVCVTSRLFFFAETFRSFVPE